MNDDQVRGWNTEGLLADVVGYETDEIARAAEGSDVETYSGAHYLDFTSGIAVHATGHNSPAVVEAIRDQACRVVHTSDVMRHAPQLALANFLRDLVGRQAPGEPWTVQFMNSGSESIDAAAKLALKATGRSQFIALRGGFHGRTLFATALSCSNLVHKRAYAPLLSRLDEAIHHAPAPRCGACDRGLRSPCCMAGIDTLIGEHGQDIAAIFIEAQQGEGGYFPMAPEAAAHIRRMADQAGILLIADEIQSGFGRTGRWFGFEHLGIVPDIIVFGKAVGGGLPLAGLLAPSTLMARWEVGEHGTTFGGNPIACAAGLAALQTIDRDGLVERAAALGERIKARLSGLIGRHGVSDVRGNGLMIGIEVRDAEGQPDYNRVGEVKRACKADGLLVLSCGARIGDSVADNATIRLLPALNVTEAGLDRALDILSKAFASPGASALTASAESR